MTDIKKYRKPEHNIDPIFINRWSPRAMSGESITDEQLMSLFEAARWAPSAYNEQEWRFIYAKRDTEAFKRFFNILAEPNKLWCKDASVLVIVISRKTFTRNDKPNQTHSFSTGSAYENLALQGSIMGLVVHGMSGFDYEKAAELAKVPENYQVEMMFAIGKPGKKEDLPEKMQEIEFPSDRKKIDKFVFEGEFKGGE